eukprot:sb/3478691/
MFLILDHFDLLLQCCTMSSYTQHLLHTYTSAFSFHLIPSQSPLCLFYLFLSLSSTRVSLAVKPTAKITGKTTIVESISRSYPLNCSSFCHICLEPRHDL